MIGYDDGRVEACVAEGKHDCREHHHHRHDAEYEQLIPAQKRERNKACDACARYRPAQGRDEDAKNRLMRLTARLNMRSARRRGVMRRM